MTEFSKKLRQARLDAGITQEELAKKMNVSKSTISMWENGNRIPSIGVLIPLADALNTTSGYLTGRAVKMVDGEAHPASAYHDSDFYGYYVNDSNEICTLVDIALNLDEDRIQRLVSYAKFLNQEEDNG